MATDTLAEGMQQVLLRIKMEQAESLLYWERDAKALVAGRSRYVQYRTQEP